MGWEPPPRSPVSAPALPMLQALAEISHMILPIWPLQGSPGTQSRSTVIRPMGVRSTRHPSAYTSPPDGLRRTLSQRPRSPLGWTLCSHGASSLSSTTLHGFSALSYSWHSCPRSLTEGTLYPAGEVPEASRLPCSLDQQQAQS